MSTQLEIIRHEQLLNQLIINRQTMEELGRIEMLWMYAPSHKVLGFIGKAGFLGTKKSAFKLTQIVALGANGILIHSQPEDTDPEKVRLLESVIQCEVWGESGSRIGKIIDYVFDLKTGDISHYLFVSDGLGGVLGEIYQLTPQQILNVGRRRVLVTEATAKKLTIYRGGLKQTVVNAGVFLKEEKAQVTEELQTLTKQVQSATVQAKGRFLNLTEHVKERVQVFSQQAKETVQTLNGQIKGGTDNVVWQVKETGQTLVEQVKERTQTLSEQVEDSIQTLTVQAREIFEADVEGGLTTSSKSMPEEYSTSPSDSLMEVENRSVSADLTESDPFDIIFAGETVPSIASGETEPTADPFDLIFGEEAIASPFAISPEEQASADGANTLPSQLRADVTTHNRETVSTSPDEDDEPWI